MSAVTLGITQSPESKGDLNKLYPTYATSKSACFDLRADLAGRTITIKGAGRDEEEEIPLDTTDGSLMLGPLERVLIPTGLIFDIPEGYRLEILPRSGRTWNDALVVMNSPARIDEDYTKETFVILQNKGFEDIFIEDMEKIAQAEINLVTRVSNIPVIEDLRNGGFGSTGN